MARASASLRYCVLRNTTSAMGPMTETCGATPVSEQGHHIGLRPALHASLASVGQRRGQPVLHGDQPARQGLPLLLSPRLLRGCGKRHSGPAVHQVSAALVVRHLRGGQCLRCRRGWLGRVCRVKNKARHTPSAAWVLYGKRSACTLLACATGGRLCR